MKPTNKLLDFTFAPLLKVIYTKRYGLLFVNYITIRFYLQVPRRQRINVMWSITFFTVR